MDHKSYRECRGGRSEKFTGAALLVVRPLGICVIAALADPIAPQMFRAMLH